MADEKQDYGKTLNLPSTEFPMRGNLPENEPKTEQEVFENDLYEKMLKINEAYDTLNDEVKRKKYDEELAEKRQREESNKFSNNSYNQQQYYQQPNMNNNQQNYYQQANSNKQNSGGSNQAKVNNEYMNAKMAEEYEQKLIYGNYE